MAKFNRAVHDKRNALEPLLGRHCVRGGRRERIIYGFEAVSNENYHPKFSAQV
jgi:hypothetical protein